jgi:hypothetical protein
MLFNPQNLAQEECQTSPALINARPATIWEEIQKRLAGIDRQELLNLDAAKEVMRGANRIEWREQRRTEREATRPATVSKAPAASRSRKARLADGLVRRNHNSLRFRCATSGLPHG